MTQLHIKQYLDIRWSSCRRTTCHPDFEEGPGGVAGFGCHLQVAPGSAPEVDTGVDIDVGTVVEMEEGDEVGLQTEE